ncbi:MAG: hypothetical protein KBF73_03470, partial [Flavobacteriales bacterium]|nr:hypothetical protein [Flavobacteriales bacterium]
METELDGTTIVLKRLLDDLKNTVDDRNIEWVAARMLHGETAVSKLIDAQLTYEEPIYEDDPHHYVDNYSDYIVNQAALYSIKRMAEKHVGGDCMPFPAYFMDVLFPYFDHEVDDELLVACWLHNCHGDNWLCQTEEYVDISDGAKMLERKWLICLDTQSRVTAKYARETIAMEMVHSINSAFQT